MDKTSANINHINKPEDTKDWRITTPKPNPNTSHVYSFSGAGGDSDQLPMKQKQDRKKKTTEDLGFEDRTAGSKKSPNLNCHPDLDSDSGKRTPPTPHADTAQVIDDTSNHSNGCKEDWIIRERTTEADTKSTKLRFTIGLNLNNRTSTRTALAR